MAATKPVRVSPETHTALNLMAISASVGVSRQVPMSELIGALTIVGKAHMAEVEAVLRGDVAVNGGAA